MFFFFFLCFFKKKRFTSINNHRGNDRERSEQGVQRTPLFSYDLSTEYNWFLLLLLAVAAHFFLRGFDAEKGLM